jgi:hypothetical protein
MFAAFFVVLYAFRIWKWQVKRTANRAANRAANHTAAA